MWTRAHPADYVPLWVKTNHSFLEGASFPTELVERAAALGLSTLAITDRNGVYGLARAHVHARQLGLRVIPGAHIEFDDAPLILLATSRLGYGNLCELLSAGQRRSETKGDATFLISDFDRWNQDLIALRPVAKSLAALRDRFETRLHGLVARHLTPQSFEDECGLLEAHARSHVPLVGATKVLYHDRSRRPLADVLACIRAGRTLANAGHAIDPNTEHLLRSPVAFSALFHDRPDLVEATLSLAARCTFDLSMISYRYPDTIPTNQTEGGYLRQLSFEGAAVRYPHGIPADVRKQLERELELIQELGYGGYFLTMHDIVQYCRHKNILCQGRGSAANSAVCFCLGITAIDPVRMDLLFERFLSRERAEPPDIDLDIEHDRREEVIQYMYERYGRRHAAMVANIVRYRARSAIREIGKALGIPSTELDSLSRLALHHDAGLTDELFREAGCDPMAPAIQQLSSLVHAIQDFPRHLSIHPGGFLLGHDPVDTLVPIEPATMEDRTVIQWDKYDVEALGLFKVDLLGLGALTCVHHSFDLIRAHEGRELEIATVPAEDRATYEMISRGDTIGVFQIESRAQMAMLPRLKPRTFYDLVIEVAIIRPGPIQGNMVHPYLRRRNGQEAIDYPHPALGRVLDKTLGVPIFQEQVMKLAILVAGYTPGEADQLRRDMAAWRRSGRLEQHHDRLVHRMMQNGVPEEFAERVFSQILGFGDYGFPESHAASFALLAYVTAWLRCHYPAAFLCAMLNSQPMGFYSPSTLISDAKRHGTIVLPIDIQKSAWDCSLERVSKNEHGVRMGLRYVKGLGEKDRQKLELIHPPHESLEHFAYRSRLSTPSLVALAKAGAFERFGLDRRTAIWRARTLGNHRDDHFEFGALLSRARFEALSSVETIAWDYHIAGHSARGHPMEELRPRLDRMRVPCASRVNQMSNGRITDFVGMVVCRQRPMTASGVTFFTLEDETGLVNLVVWRSVFDRFHSIAKTAPLLGVHGSLQVADNVVHLVATHLWAPAFSTEATPASRNFA